MVSEDPGLASVLAERLREGVMTNRNGGAPVLVELLSQPLGLCWGTAECVSTHDILDHLGVCRLTLTERLMSVRPHEVLTRPETNAMALSRERLIRRRFKRRLRLLQIPDNLTGWTVLDIGAWHGFFSFECERRGAKRVLAVDNYAWNRFGMDEFLSARERLGSKVEYQRLDVYDLDPAAIGQFDLVLLLGVLYHLRNPLLALEQIKAVTKRLLICETHVLLPFMHERYPLIPFFPGDENAEEKPFEICAMPTLEALRQMLKSAGFTDLRTVYTPSFRHWKKLVALLTNRPQSGRGIIHATAQTTRY